jgi:hypothetical protein
VPSTNDTNVGRKAVYQNDHVVTVVPGAAKPGREMKPGMRNHTLFQIIVDNAPVTTKDLRKLGVTSGYLKYFQDHGMVRVDPPVAAAGGSDAQAA